MNVIRNAEWAALSCAVCLADPVTTKELRPQSPLAFRGARRIKSLPQTAHPHKNLFTGRQIVDLVAAGDFLESGDRQGV